MSNRTLDIPVRISLGWIDRDLAVGTHMSFYYSDDACLKDAVYILRGGTDDPDAVIALYADARRTE